LTPAFDVGFGGHPLRATSNRGAASLDVLRLRKLVTPERYERGIRLLEGEVAMLTKMVR
jgi:hypothetical protein